MWFFYIFLAVQNHTVTQNLIIMNDNYYNAYYNIKRLREITGEKQETVARMLGITQSAYSRIENGESDLSMKHIHKLCAFYRIKEADFFSWDGKGSPPSS